MVDGKVEGFHNVLDKVFKVTREAFSHNQKVVQPVFSRNGLAFKGNEGLRISEVASDRSGNERATNECKQSKFISRGIERAQSFDRMNDSWKAFSFQCEFLHEPVV